MTAGRAGSKVLIHALSLLFLLAIFRGVSAQMFPPPPPDPRPAKVTAPFDPTGYWVSIVTEDWRYRMRTPPRGDYPGLFLNPKARAIADAWDPAQDEAAGEECKSYGAGAIMRVPTRLHVTWVDDNTLKIETDAGEQTRLLQFGKTIDMSGAGAWQGVSRAEWEIRGATQPGPGSTPRTGSLKVVTTDMRPGYIRKNGVPYGAKAVVTEYFDLVTEASGDQYLIVVTLLEDPEYLLAPVLTSSNFRKQRDGKGWNPMPCSAR
jgi:hypothetical protein